MAAHSLYYSRPDNELSERCQEANEEMKKEYG